MRTRTCRCFSGDVAAAAVRALPCVASPRLAMVLCRCYCSASCCFVATSSDALLLLRLACRRSRWRCLLLPVASRRPIAPIATASAAPQRERPAVRKPRLTPPPLLLLLCGRSCRPRRVWQPDRMSLAASAMPSRPATAACLAPCPASLTGQASRHAGPRLAPSSWACPLDSAAAVLQK